MISTKDAFLTGASICAMFFGSGNIVLPLLIGQQYANNWVSGYFGFVVGAVLIPILGLISISLKKGNSDEFFGCLSKCKLGFLIIPLQLFLLAIIGPFGITPRCLAVALGGFKAICPSGSDYIFYFVMAALLYFVTCKKEQIMPIIGKILTPPKLGLLIGVVIFCLLFIPEGSHIVSKTAPTSDVLLYGLISGYQTTDLIGSIFYGTIILDYIRRKNPTADIDKKALLSFGIRASIFGSFFLMLLYLGFLLMGVFYNNSIQGLLPEDLFPVIARECMGNSISIVVGVTIIVSCFTTAVGLLSAWTMFITNLLNKAVKVSYNAVLLVSVVLTYFLSLLGLQSILDLLEPILTWVYLILILMMLYNLTKDLKGINNGK